MKTLITAVLGSFGGAALGIALSLPFMHFIPMCGEDCAARRLELLLSCALVGAILVFATCLALQVKRSRTAVWTVTLGAELIITLVAAMGAYIHKLREENAYFYSIREIQPESDFYLTVVAKEDVQAYAFHAPENRETSILIKQWERCTSGGPAEGRTQIHCRSGYGWVDRAVLLKKFAFVHDPRLRYDESEDRSK